jgi:cysteine synthase
VTRYDDILQAIGNTPLVGMPRMSPKSGVRLWAKLEGANPTGSTKDRIALKMVEAAEASGELTPDNTILEPTSGNTGIALAMVAARKGYGLTVVIPDNASEERIGLLRLFGAEIVFSDGDKGTNGSIEVARALAADDKYYMPFQYGNPANPLAHQEGTAQEIIRDLPEITHFVGGMGTGGTLTGTGRGLHAHNPDVKIVAAEPELGDLVYGLRSLDAGFIPPIFDPHQIDRKFLVDSSSSLRTNRELTEGGYLRRHLERRGGLGGPAHRDGDRRGRHRLPAARRRLEVPVDRGLGRRSRDRREGRRGVAVVVSP